jgi:hypothetical protein
MLAEFLRLQFLTAQTNLTPSETKELEQLQHLHNLRLSIINNDRLAKTLTIPVVPEEFDSTQQAKITQHNQTISKRHAEYAQAVTELYQAYHTLWLTLAVQNATLRGPAATRD